MKLDKKKLRLILTIIAAIIVVGYVIKNMRTAEDPGSTTAGFETIDPDETTKATEAPETEDAGITVKKGKSYTDKDHVALYIHQYGELPPNFVTKEEAEDEGWKDTAYYVGDAMPGCSIGGDEFKNREGQLPKKNGRKYYECDIDYSGRKRNEKRIVYSSDGLIYYTEDHYETFELLYGNPNGKE